MLAGTLVEKGCKGRKIGRLKPQIDVLPNLPCSYHPV